LTAFAWGGMAFGGSSTHLSVSGNGSINLTASSLASGSNATVAALGAASISLTAAGGISFYSGTRITTVDGALTASANLGGIDVNGATIAATGLGVVTVQGKGGNGDSIYGSGSEGRQYGVAVRNGGMISGSPSGALVVRGSGGTSTGSQNYGVYVAGSGSAITSSGGNVQVTGVEGAGSSGLAIATESSGSISTAKNGGTLTLVGNSMSFATASVISASAASNLTLRPLTSGVGVNLGLATDPIGGPLALTNSDLAYVTAGMLQIGDENSGPITFSGNIARGVRTDIKLVSGGDIEFTTGSLSTADGNVMFVPGIAGSVRAGHAGVDVATGGLATLSFTPDRSLAIAINGATVDTQYEQLNVSGQVDVTGIDLVLSGSYSPAIGDAFMVVQNDGSDEVIGEFNGLADGTTFHITTGPLVGFYEISYHGGDGNDVVITTVGEAPTLNSISSPSAIDEDAGEQQIILSGIGPGPASAIFSITATSSNHELLLDPSIEYAGGTTALLSYKPIANQFGSALITVTVRDGNLVDSHDDNSFFSRSFTVVVNSLNDPPRFDHLTGNYSATDENPLNNGPALQQVVPGWAANISLGPADESSQQPTFVVHSDNPGLFAVQPAVDPLSGMLTYQPAPNKHGTANVTVVLKDDGGEANASAEYSFSIVIIKSHPLHNAAEAGARSGRDVTGSNLTDGPDGLITAGDVLAIINYINAKGAGKIPGSQPPGPPFCDVDADDEVTPSDVVLVINYLNADVGQSAGEGEGESPLDDAVVVGQAFEQSLIANTDSPADSSADLLSLIAADSASATLKRRRAL